MSGSQLNREELLRDSQATLREVAGLLGELWDLREPQPHSPPGPVPAWPTDAGSRDLRLVLADTHREVEALRNGIGALQDLLPFALSDGDRNAPGSRSPQTSRGRRMNRASEILRDVQARLDRLAGAIEDQGIGMD